MSKNDLDLASLFGAVTQELASNQQTLNEEDTYNRDHGDNMVQTFQAITKALEKKQNSSPSAALSYAAKKVTKSSSSGSSQIYAQNLSQAANQFKGKPMDAQDALPLLMTLIGGGQSGQPTQTGEGDLMGALLGGLTGGQQTMQQPVQTSGDDLLGSLMGGLMGGGMPSSSPSSQSSGDDLLGALLGGMTGGGQQTTQTPSQPAGDDLLGSLLGGLMGGGQSPQQPSQSAGGNLLGALLGGSSGGSDDLLPTLVQAFLGGSGMGNSTHRKDSTQIVIKAFLQALKLLNSRK